MPIIMDQVSIFAPNNPAHRILKNICCTFEDGTVTLIIGKTGSGKSTLLDVLAGLTEVREGKVWFDHCMLWDGKQLNDAARLKTGSVFQHPEHHLFARTVKGEFDYSLKPYRLSKQEATERIKTSMYTMNLSQDLLIQSPFVLSGGQKRRVALGTTFATEPEWLLLDEPTSGLDPEAVQALVGFIKEWKEKTSGGMVIATHDLDAFFPIADRVLLIDDGYMKACVSPEELCENPDILIQAGVGIPSCLEASILLRKQGIKVPAGLISAEKMAKVISDEIEQKRKFKQKTRSSRPDLFNQANQQINQEGSDSIRANDPNSNLNRNDSVLFLSSSRYIQDLDPRTKWIFYILISIGILFQQTWTGLFFATLMTVILVVLSQVPIRDLKKIVNPFFFFIFISMVLSGIHIDFKQWHLTEIGFSFANAQNTGKQLFRIVLIMMLGMLFPLTTSHIKIKRGLEQSLSFIPWMKLPAEAVALTVALMLRFIPMILKEVNRFSRIVRARGKTRTKPGSIRLRDIHVVMIPLLLSVFQLAENLSLAMEVRGYKKMGLPRTSCIQLQMNRRDTAAILIGSMLLCILVVVNKLV